MVNNVPLGKSSRRIHGWLQAGYRCCGCVKLAWSATKAPRISASRSAFRPTSSKPAAPMTRAMNNPKRTNSSPWPQRSIIAIRTGLRGKRPNKSTAQREGSLILDAAKKITAKISCMIRIPMAVRPCNARISPLSSKTLTAQIPCWKNSAQRRRKATF